MHYYTITTTGGNDTANSSQPTASQEFNGPRVDSIASEEDPSEEDPSEESNQGIITTYW